MVVQSSITRAEARLNDRLRESEARLQAAINLVGLSMYTWDPATGALGWDAAESDVGPAAGRARR